MTLSWVVIRGNAAEPGSYGPVQANESLYRIALKYRQKNITVSQLMMSIYEANPDAFHQGNINRLKLGATLKIPDIATISSLNRTQAYLEASAQIDAYEDELRAGKVERGELEPLSQAPRDPDLTTGAPVMLTVSEPSLEQIEEVKQGLAADEQQADLVLPEPKAAQQARKASSDKSVFRYSYDVSLADDDNVRLAQEDDDIRGDFILSGRVNAKGGKSLDSFSILNYGASAGYNKFETFDTLDNFEFEFNTRYRFALSSGFTSPIYSLRAKIGGREFDTEMRDATFVGVSADMNKWLTNTLNMTAGIGYNAQESKSEVFDTQEWRLFFNLDTNFTKTDLVYTTFTYITGDTVSSSTPSLGVINAADAIEPDDAFGGIEANQFAYRIDADTYVYTLGYNRILTRDLSIDLSARYVDSKASYDSSIAYERTIFTVSLLGRF